MSVQHITKTKKIISDKMSSKTDWDRVKKMTERDIVRAANSDPDAPIATKEELSRARRVYPLPNLNVKEIREKLHFSEELFAFYFGVTQRTLRDWELGRRIPKGPARALLTVMDKRPDMVKNILQTVRVR